MLSGRALGVVSGHGLGCGPGVVWVFWEWFGSGLGVVQVWSRVCSGYGLGRVWTWFEACGLDVVKAWFGVWSGCPGRGLGMVWDVVWGAVWVRFGTDLQCSDAASEAPARMNKHVPAQRLPRFKHCHLYTARFHFLFVKDRAQPLHAEAFSHSQNGERLASLQLELRKNVVAQAGPE